MILREDAVVHYEDESPQPPCVPYPYRFEPAFAAMAASGQDMDFLSTSVITGLNCLYRLLKYASGTATEKFRIDVQVIGKSIFMSRWEQDLSSIAKMSLTRGYGKGFELACTERQETGKDLSSFHRLVSYKLADLDLLVQHEVDACRCDCATTVSEHNYDACTKSRLRILEPAQPASGQGTTPVSTNSDPLRIVKSGTKHDTSCLVELKSRALGNTSMDDVFGKLWLSRCHQLLLGYHQRGRFSSENVTLEDLTLKLQQWQQANVGPISNLVKLIRQLRSVVVAAQESGAPSRYALLHMPNSDKQGLYLYKCLDGQEMLPSHLWDILTTPKSAQ
nr:hypothetical protein CFP56_54391 [Quercus suber]